MSSFTISIKCKMLVKDNLCQSELRVTAGVKVALSIFLHLGTKVLFSTEMKIQKVVDPVVGRGAG